MQIILSKEEQDTFATLLKDIADMKSGLAEIRALLQNNTNPPDIIWPYGNWENCKYTFPDASERPAPDIRKTDFENPYIKFAPDGSIGFDLPEGMDFTPPRTRNIRASNAANTKELRQRRTSRRATSSPAALSSSSTN